jgi:hypothetical protein
MTTPRKRSSTKRDNLIGYWLDANTGRLRGYPPETSGEAAPSQPPQSEPTTEPTSEPTTEPATGRSTEPSTEPKRPRGKKRVHNEREPLPPHIRAGHVLELTDKRGWKSRLNEQAEPGVLVVRDRFGFRWERWIGLHDDVSQVEAARLLGVPLTRLNRWVHTKKLKSRMLRGYSVIRARDLYRLALDLKLEVPRGRPFGVVGLHHEDP